MTTTVMGSLLVCMLLVQVNSTYNRKANENYNRLEFRCNQKCDDRGYFKELCIKMCLSVPCYQQIYQKGEVVGAGGLEYGLMEDPKES